VLVPRGEGLAIAHGANVPIDEEAEAHNPIKRQQQHAARLGGPFSLGESAVCLSSCCRRRRRHPVCLYR
jgi:hypothetical protein